MSPRQLSLLRRLLPLLLVAACGEPITASRLAVPIALRLVAVVGSPVPLDGERVDVSVSGVGISTPIFGSFRFTGDSAVADLRVPVGRDRLVSVAVFDSLNVLIASGEIVVDVGSGATPTVPVPVAPSDGQLPVVVTVGNTTLTVTPGSLLLAPNDTLPLSVAITNAQGVPIAGATPSFASSNPALVGVTSTGLVIGKLVGVTAVTVTYNGVAARIPVSVSLPALQGVR